jgi:heme oxygenase
MITANMPDKRIDLSRSIRLKNLTRATRGQLDRLIMQQKPFASREHYAAFLNVQHRFYHAVDFLYWAPELRALIPDLPSRRRLDLIRKDIADLEGTKWPLRVQAPYLIDVPNALGWLYVAESSDLRAAFLIEEVAKLGLSENFGARHLCVAPEVRARQWKTLTAVLDVAALGDDDELRLVAGAESAFALVRNLVEEMFVPTRSFAFMPAASSSPKFAYSRNAG